MRSTWNGELALGMVRIPIKLYSTTESKASISFNQLHTCGTKLNQKLWCGHCATEVARADVRRGYEWAKGQFVEITDVELAALETASDSKAIKVQTIVPGEQLTATYIDSTDYIGPSGSKESGSAYAVIRDALAGHVAIGTVIMRGRVNVVAVQAQGSALVCHYLRYPSEIRAVTDVPFMDVLPALAAVDEVRMAKRLIELYRGDLDFASYRDEYAESVAALVKAKATGTVVPFTPTTASAQPVVSDLMAALRASLDDVPKPKAAKASLPKAKPTKKRA